MSRKKKIYKKKGSVIKNLTRDIFKIFNNDSSKYYNYKQIASKLGVTNPDGKTQILKKLAELKETKKIKEVDRGKYQIVIDKKYHIGSLDITSNGNGYFVSDDFEKDIFIPSNNLGKGLQNDTVKAYVYKRNRSNKLEADIIEIIERDKTSFVGVLQMSKNFGFVLCDNQKMYVDIFISKARVNGAEHGDKVQVKITDWPENSKNPFGKITQVLGKPGDHNTEIHSILLEYGLPYRFENEVEKDASSLSLEITKEEISKRRDMRQDLTFTIDPKDAKDFDDALSFTKLKNGNYEIGIHIADVSHYVQPNTILDKEAYKVKIKSLRDKISLVSQDTTLFDDTIKNNIKYAKNDVTDEEVISAAKFSYAHEFIEKLPKKYETIIGENGIRLSGGEKQRLSIARAMIKKSPIILLDEATSSLDAETESKIQGALKILTKDRTTIVIAHRLSTILNSDQIYIIDSGNVVANGKHDELLNNSELYKNFYEKQIRKE